MFASAAQTYRNSFAAGLEPDPDLTVSEWAEHHRVLPAESSAYPGPWRNAMVPYLVEVMDCLSPSHPCHTVTLKKSAQIAGTEAGTNWLCYIADAVPGPTLVVHPTVDAGKSWSREKFQPSLEASPRLRRKVIEQKSRDGASTGSFKKFAGGYIVITGANSSAALRQKSIRYVLKDDWDDWPWDVDGQGDPDKMADARQIGFHASGLAKTFQVSTPTIKALSRIEAAYEASDQRLYYVPCPHCQHEQVLAWRNLKFAKEAPHQSEYMCAECGVMIAHHHKRQMLARGRWVATRPGPGRQPGFAINALYSPFTTWDKMVEAFVAAKDDPAKLKTWVNLWLGEAWEERGDAPQWQALMARREPYKLGTLPPGALRLTCGVDAGKTYLQYEVVAWGVGKTSWSIDYGQIPGDVTKPEVWQKLTEVIGRQYQDAYGNLRRIEMTAVDSGAFSAFVYAWARGRWNVMAIKGEDGPARPPLGLAKDVDITHRGKRKRRGLKLFLVGSWPLKSEFYANMRKSGPRDGQADFDMGYCHFSEGHDEEFFRQLTAEAFVVREKNGKPHGEWIKKGPNHALDARVYAMAAAEHPTIRLSQMTVADWQRLATLRQAPPEAVQGDLMSLMTMMAQPVAPHPASAPRQAAVEAPPPPMPTPAPAPAAVPQPPRAIPGRYKKRSSFMN
ncbi:MAG: phage terminase large subunit family protein [Alphaproteobacteria bacterium]|nr:phage terminase large subunit family protein [Alphaproteobacteria bacterium]